MTRLDVELLNRRLVPTRAAGRRAVIDGRVTVDGATVDRPAAKVTSDTIVTVDPDATRYVSRAGHKLAAALDLFDLDPAGRRCLDIGASTGGFTDVLLQRGAHSVTAVDVGSEQLHPSLRHDGRVEVRESTDIRHVTVDDLGGAFALVTVDVSFISLRLLTTVIADLTAVDGDVVVLVKPQFEVGRDGLRKDGVVADPHRAAEAVTEILAAFAAAGLGECGVTPSTIRGSAGNQETLAWLRHDRSRGLDRSGGHDRSGERS